MLVLDSPWVWSQKAVTIASSGHALTRYMTQKWWTDGLYNAQEVLAWRPSSPPWFHGVAYGWDNSPIAINSSGSTLVYAAYGPWWSDGGDTVLWLQGRGLFDLSGPDDEEFLANDLSDTGIVAGSYLEEHGLGSVSVPALIRHGDVVEKIPTPGFSGDAVEVNSAGDVIGTYRTATFPGDREEFFFFRSANRTIFESFPRGRRDGRRIVEMNDLGVVLFENDPTDRDPNPFLWDVSTGLRDLESLIPSDSPWDLLEPRGLDNLGEIVCTARHVSTGEQQGVLLRPVFDDGAILVPNRQDGRIWVFDPDTAAPVGFLPDRGTGPEADGLLEVVDGPGRGLLVADEAADVIHLLGPRGDRVRTFATASDIRGLTREHGGVVVGAGTFDDGTDGIFTWNADGALDSFTPLESVRDVRLHRAGAVHRYFVTETDRDSAASYLADFALEDRLDDGAANDPGQIEITRDRRALIASEVGGTVSIFDLETRAEIDVLHLGNHAWGVHQLDHRTLLITTPDGLLRYDEPTRTWTPVVARPGFRYINRCVNFEGP